MAFTRISVAALALAVGAGTVVASGAARTSAPAASASGGPALSSSARPAVQVPSDADNHFLEKASEGNVFEVKAGQLAAKKATRQNIRAFGKWMVSQHTALENQLKPVAASVGVTPAPGLMGQQQIDYRKLKGLSGVPFDQAYVETMVKSHKTDLKAFEKEAAHGSAPAVKKLASRGAPVIQRHLDRIQQVAETDGYTVPSA